MNYEDCARPFPAPETKYDAVNSSFTTLDTTDSRTSRGISFEVRPWGRTESVTSKRMIVIRLYRWIIRWIAKKPGWMDE